MPVTMQEVRSYLEPDEPDYRSAAQLGPEALPHLEVLIRGPDAMLASKAAYVAALIPDERAVAVLDKAAGSPDARVRVAAAAGMRKAPAVAEEVILRLVKDEDVGVRKTALHAIRGRLTPSLRARLEESASQESRLSLRTLFNEVLRTGAREGQVTRGPREEAEAFTARAGKEGAGEGGGALEAGMPGPQRMPGMAPGDGTGDGGGDVGTGYRGAMASSGITLGQERGELVGAMSAGQGEGGGGGGGGNGATSRPLTAESRLALGVSSHGGGQI